LTKLAIRILSTVSAEATLGKLGSHKLYMLKSLSLQKWLAIALIINAMVMLPLGLQAQLVDPVMSVHGTNVFISNNTFLSVRGLNTQLQTEGVDGTFDGGGQIILQDSNWINLNANGGSGFTAASTVTTVTEFPNLGILQPSIVFLNNNIDTRVRTQFALNNGQFRTLANRITMLSTQTSNLVYQNGFVASDIGGRFVRNTASTETYIFPVGNNNEPGKPLRIRPVQVVPSSAAANSFAVRFAHTDPFNEGYPTDRAFLDSILCVINDQYYHIVEPAQPGTIADLSFIFDQSTDSPYRDTFAYWNAAQQFWLPMGPGSMNYSPGGTFPSVARPAIASHPGWDRWDDGVFALGNIRPTNNFTYLPAPPDEILAGDPVRFFSQNNPLFAVQWDFGDGNFSTEQNPTHTYNEPGFYTVALTVVNPNSPGCEEIYIQQLFVRPRFLITNPNAFSPNGDVNNQRFEIKYYGVNNVTLYVFNRWGNKLFTGEFQYPNPAVWDPAAEGKIYPEGVYVYRLIGTVDATGEKIERTGTITLLR
jgi:gliding motility-associated-like protein